MTQLLMHPKSSKPPQSPSDDECVKSHLVHIAAAPFGFSTTGSRQLWSLSGKRGRHRLTSLERHTVAGCHKHRGTAKFMLDPAIRSEFGQK